MPKWTRLDEERLRKLILEGECLEDIALFLKRSPDAIVMKAKRMGLPVPKRKGESFPRNQRNKVTNSATTTTQAKPLTPVDVKELPAPYEALGLLWAAVRRLQEPNVNVEEIKKLRLIIMGVKGYTTLLANYVYRLREMEQHMLTMMKAQLANFKSLLAQAETPEQKALYEEHVKRLEESIAQMEAEGV
ncbi:MAG: hypothetical protein QW175_06975, partial [Candidatus Bathyarchaeia archaeon]